MQPTKDVLFFQVVLKFSFMKDGKRKINEKLFQVLINDLLKMNENKKKNMQHRARVI